MSNHLESENVVVPLLRPQQAVAERRQQEKLAAIGSSAIVDGLFSLLEGTPGFAAIADIKGSMLYVSEQGQANLGLSNLDEVYGHELADLYPAKHGDFLHSRAIPHAIRHGKWYGEMTMTDRGGDEIPVLQLIIFQRTSSSNGYLLSIAWDMRRQKQTESVLRHKATHDELTSLPNRRLLVDRLEQALNRSRRDGKITGVIFMDLNRFKAINDHLGHESANHVLREAARRLSACVRAVDTVGRYGGDEFVAILPKLNEKDQVKQILQRMNHALEAPIRVGKRQLIVTMSCGVSFYPGHACEARKLLSIADEEMYRNKRKRAAYSFDQCAPSHRALVAERGNGKDDTASVAAME